MNLTYEINIFYIYVIYLMNSSVASKTNWNYELDTALSCWRSTISNIALLPSSIHNWFLYFCLSFLCVPLFIFLHQKPSSIRLPMAKFCRYAFPITYRTSNQPLAHVAARFCLHFVYLFIISTSNHQFTYINVYLLFWCFLFICIWSQREFIFVYFSLVCSFFMCSNRTI